MEIIAAAAAFVVLFALWVVVPRFCIQRKQKANNPAPRQRFSTELPSDLPAPQAAD